MAPAVSGQAADMDRAQERGAVCIDEPVLRVSGLSKSFGVERVLQDIGLEIGRNQIVGIVGENGAGKTTLFNIISGVLQPDAGEMFLRGVRYRPRSYREAHSRGISRVFQEQALIPNIRVYENLLLAHEASFTRFGQWLDKGRMIRVAQQVMDQAGLAIDVRRLTSSYSFSKRQLIEVARACIVPTEILGAEDPVVLLDEPTSALERADEETFRGLVTHLRRRASIVFVSHRLTEVLELSDVILVLKDGRLVERIASGEADERRLHGLMVGRERDADYYHEDAQRSPSAGCEALRVQGLSWAGEYTGVSLGIACGEIVGVGGLLNSGKSELGRGIAGIVPPDSGTVAVGDGPAVTPAVRTLKRLGLGYMPAERLLEGMIPAYAVSWNISLAGGDDMFSDGVGLWRGRLESRVAHGYIRSMPIKAPGPGSTCLTLSGGNQQKVVLARWLCRNPRLLVLDNPTRGVDAGAKEEIYKLLRMLCTEGMGILLITDDLLELIGLSARIAIMQHGRIVRMVDAPPHAKPSERELVEAMLEEPEGGVHGDDGDAWRAAS